MVKIKIKTNKKRVYEAAPSLSRHTVKLDVKMKSPEERQRELNDLWGRLIKQKNIDIRKLYGATMNNSGYSILSHVPSAYAFPPQIVTVCRISFLKM